LTLSISAIFQNGVITRLTHPILLTRLEKCHTVLHKNYTVVDNFPKSYLIVDNVIQYTNDNIPISGLKYWYIIGLIGTIKLHQKESFSGQEDILIEI